MTPSAHLSAVIELLDSLLQSWQGEKRIPADAAIDRYFKARRYIGSHDRGSISEMTYWIIRHKALIEWWCARQRMDASARILTLTAVLLRKDTNVNQLAKLFDGSKYAPLPLTDREWQYAHYLDKQDKEPSEMPEWVRLNYPQWLEKQLKDTLGKHFTKEMEAMEEQAPVDLRANTLRLPRERVLEEIKKAGWEAEPTQLSQLGIRLKKRQAIFASDLFKNGLFEMQDEGSQAVAELVDAQPGMKVIDFCAGAGGKTLALAASMQNKGRILAWDTSEKRLAQLPQRLKRAGVDNTELRVIVSENDPYIKRHKLSADRVLVDAPCSGSGTWRRNPDLKWRFTETDLNEVVDVQQRILASAARLVKPGGRLIYATCSLLSRENDKQVEEFLKTRSNFRVVCAKKVWNKTAKSDVTGADKKSTNGNVNANQETDPVSYLWLTPHQDGVDGFFAAVLERVSA